MTTLTINDLSRNEEMDRDGMADVRGGMLTLSRSDLDIYRWYSPTLTFFPGSITE